jgi:calcineurin-like phosphoesterase family protein
MATFLTADWHLGEDRLEILQRPFDSALHMIDSLVERHNSIVMPDDEVIVVGDVLYQNAPKYCLDHVGKFNGRKTLIRGNHDRHLSDEELQPYFERIIPDGGGIELEVDGIPCYATHYPTQGKVDRFNLVGHIHMTWKHQLNMLNVGVDVHHFYPLPLDKVPFHFTAINEYYDEDVWVAYREVNKDYRGIRGKPGRYFQEPGNFMWGPELGK